MLTHILIPESAPVVALIATDMATDRNILSLILDLGLNPESCLVMRQSTFSNIVAIGVMCLPVASAVTCPGLGTACKAARYSLMGGNS